MNLLECLVGLLLSIALLSPLLKITADLLVKQLHYEKTQILIADGDRALELMGRAIRMAGYKNIHSGQNENKKAHDYITIEKQSGYRGSDAFIVKHNLSDGIDFDCIGNVLTQDRTRHGLASYGFKLERQSSIPKGSITNGGSLMCQSLDRQGRIQNVMMMNGVEQLLVEEVIDSQASNMQGQKLYRVKLKMTDGHRVKLNLERSFATRNLP